MNTQKKRAPRAPATLLAGLLLAASLLLPASAAAAAVQPAYSGRSFLFLQFNMAGGTMNEGGLGVADAVVRSVKDRYPHIITLNEVCYRQYARIRDQLSGSGYYARFGQTIPASSTSRCQGTAYGNAILFRMSIAWSSNTRLYDNGGETRAILCAKPSAYNLVACATHITHLTTGRFYQIQSVRNRVSYYRNQGYHVAVGGDFNETPNHNNLDQIYHTCYPGGAGGFMHEVDVDSWCGNRTGEGTHSRGKIDYIFLTPGWDGPLWGDATYSSYSDHDPLWGKAWLTWAELS